MESELDCISTMTKGIFFMDTIIKAIPQENYKIKILTGSGISGFFDVQPYLNGSAFKELSNQAYFNLVSLSRYGIKWPNEQDFSSDTIIHDIQKSQSL
jgi:Protein of unknown function (DUF2442)